MTTGGERQFRAHETQDFADVGGLMSYSRDIADSYPPGRGLCRSNPEG